MGTRLKSFRKTLRSTLLVVFVLPIAARGTLYAVEDHPRSWRDANWSSTGLLPDAADDPPARVLVFAGRAGGWRGIFAVHTWMVVKPENADAYTRYDVMGFGQPVRVNLHAPDGYWFGDRPQLVADVRGARAAVAIPKIEAAVKRYPYASYGSYRVWPGPNSNTFTATLLRAAPELEIAMPPEAVGRDFRADGAFVGLTASRTGVEAGIYGLIGAKLGWVEGVEVDFMGLVAGLDLRHPALKIPCVGRVGVAPVATANAR
ncbi:MAG TPA: DUF3750 domain-containing protein [Xanthobacteraceae bacterium]|nr:DUF3750 domain-containing protein [Xanthobacteraceae bacterium]